MAYRNRSIPDSDKGIRRFVYNFSRSIAEDPALYGFDAADAALLLAEAEFLIQKMVVAERPDTRTMPAIRAKHDAKKRVLKIFRSYVARVKANPEIDSFAKSRLSLATNGKRRKSATPPPAHSPHILVQCDGDNRHRVRFWETLKQNNQRKPEGATHLLLLCHVGAQPGGSPQQARYVGGFSRSPFMVEHDPKDSGLVATYFAAWLMRSGEQSPWTRGEAVRITSSEVGHGPITQETSQRFHLRNAA